MMVLDVRGNTEEKNSGKWKGYITASIAVPLDKAWQIGSDFSGLHKFVPIVEVCERLKGCNRTPGCLRFYTMNSATGLPGGRRKAWAKDRLLNIEEEIHSYTYAMEGSNMNLENCQITFTASDGKDGTTIVTWAWEVDPIKKSTKEKTLSDMSEFGCTFIKGLEAAVATTDSIDFNFEGALLDIDTLPDAGGDGGGPYDPTVPALSLMKGRLDTLTQSLNKICQRLESGPIPADLYQSELEILQSTLADGRRSLVNHLHAYMLDACVDQSNKSLGTSDIIGERCEEVKNCPLLSEKIVSQNNDSNVTCKSDKGYEDCYLLSSHETIVSPPKMTNERVDALMCPDNAKVRSTPDGQCQACPAKFPRLASEEDLRVEMDNASRCANEAFQDFSNQFQSDLRDDISHQLEFVGIRLEALGFHMQESLIAGVKCGPSNIHSTPESRELSPSQFPQRVRNVPTEVRNNALGAGEDGKEGCEEGEEGEEGEEKAQISTQERSNDVLWPSSSSSNGAKWPSSPSSNVAKWPFSPSSDGTKGPSSPSSNDAKMPPSPDCQTLEDDHGQFGVWELDALRSQRLQKSQQGIHSVRFRSRLLFQDLLQMEMSQDSDHRSHETKTSSTTPQPTDSIQEIRLSRACIPFCQSSLLGGQELPSQCPQRVRNVSTEYPSQPQSSELGSFRKSPPTQGDNRRNQGSFQIKDHQSLCELETGGHDQGLQMDHRTFEICRRPLGPEAHEASLLSIMSEHNNPSVFASSKESGEGYQQLQDNAQGWEHRGSMTRRIGQNLQSDLSSPQITENKMLLQDNAQDWEYRGSTMRRTGQKLQADLSRPQITENKILNGTSPESRDDEFYRHNALPRPSRLPPDIWPDFSQGESGGERVSVKKRQSGDIPKEVQVEDISKKGEVAYKFKKEQGEDNIRRECSGHDRDMFELRRERFYSSPLSLDIMGEPTSSSAPQSLENYKNILQFKSKSFPARLTPSVEPVQTSSCALQSLENYKKILQFKSKSLPAQLTPPIDPVHQMMTSSSMLSLEKIPFKLGSEGSTTSPVSGIPSGSTNYSSACPPSAAHPFGQCSEHVTLDLRNEIAPGVFHCRQGNQTRVVVNVPDEVETRDEIRRHMRSLHRKDEIYKEFKLLGIQKPPTEQEILEGFVEARLQKQQELLALSDTEMLVNDSPIFQPNYSDGKVCNADAGHLSTVDKSRFEQEDDACTWDPTSLSCFSAGHSTDAKPPSGQNVGQPSKTKHLSCKNATSRKQSTNGRVFERMLESEQQGTVTSSFHKDASSMSTQSLRGDPTARELAMCDSNKTQIPWDGFNGRQGSQPRVQTPEGSTYRHSYPPVQKREFLIKGHGHRTPHVQPSSSSTKKKTKTGVSSLTESSSHATTTSSGDNACPGHKAMGSGDSFAHLERVDEISSEFSTSPEIRVYSQAELRKRRDTPAIVASNLESRQPAVSPQLSSECSIAKIISNPQRVAENNLMRTSSSSRQLFLDEAVDKKPSESRSPFRTSGKLGSITHSPETTGSDSNTTCNPETWGYPEAQMLKTNAHAITTSSTLESRQFAVSPQSLRSSTDCSMAKVLSNFPRDDEDFLLMDIMRNKRPSPQLSLDEVVKNVPSESGSSEFDPFRDLFRASGKLGSITGSGSNSSSGHSSTGQVIGHVSHFTPSGKPTSMTSAQSNPLIDSLMSSDNLAKVQQGSSNAMESRRHEDCPFRQLKDKLDEAIQSSESSSPRHLEGRPRDFNVRVSWADQRSQYRGSSSSMGEGSGGTSSSWKNLAFSATLDGMPQAYDSSQQSDQRMPQAYDNSQQSDLNVILEEPGPFFDRMTKDCGRGNSQWSLSPVSHEVCRQLDPEKVRKTYRDAETQTDLPEESEGTQKWSSKSSQIQSLFGVEGLSTRQSTQMVDSMANIADFMDAQNSHSQMLEHPTDTQNLSSQTSQTPRLSGVEGLKTSQNIQKMESLANVAQFMDAQNSYSQMLDDVVGQTVESISSFKARKKREADELAFRTRQSAQMLNSMLNVREFSDDSRSYSVWLDGVVPLSVIQTPMQDSEVQTPMNDSEIQTPWNESESGVPREPRFREDSAANFIGSVAMQILQEFGDSKKPEADTKDQLDPSFQEDSLDFLGALSKQIVKEYTDYTNDQSSTEGQSEGPREPRFREQSALNFLSALSEHVLPEFRDRSGSQVIGVPRPGEPRFRKKSAINFLSALREQIMQRNGQYSISTLPSTSNSLPRNQVNLTESVNSQTAIENEPYPDLQPDLENRASSIEILNYQPESDGQVSPEEGVTYQSASSVGQAYPDEGLSFQPESEGQGTPGENLSYQPEPEGLPYPDDGLSYRPELEGTPGESSSHQPASEGQGYPDEGLSFQLDSEGQSTPGNKLSYQPDLEDQAYLDEGLSYQNVSEGQSSLGDVLSHQADPEGQSFPDESFSLKPESEGQSTPGENSSDQPAPKGGGYPDERPSYQPESEDQSSPGDQLDPEDQAFWDKGLTFEPESEGQETPGENFSDEPYPEDEAYPNEDLNDLPEDEAEPFEGLNDQPEGEVFPDEGLDDQPDVEGEAYPDESLNEQPEDQASETESGTTGHESQNESRRNSQFQLGPRSSQRSSQVAQLNEMLQDLHTTVSRSRQNSVSNSGK